MSRREKYEDISSSGKPEGFKEKSHYRLEKIKIFFMKNRQRNLKAFLSVIICLILVVAAMGGAYLRKMLSLINYDDGNIGDPNATFQNDTDYDENLSFAAISDVGANSIKEWCCNWSNNGGEKLYSKYVINVLLIGEDNTDGATHSDSIILASVNIKEKKITLCSIMRDSYTYMNIKDQDRYDKINAAYAWGGPSALMKTISDDLKIRIDHYVSINFSSFIKVVDALGGVTVPVTEKEANFMNRTTKMKGFESGDAVTLDGEHALVYARIRKLDSDVERTRRQRNVIAAAVRGIKASSISDINNLIETFLPYVTTDFKSAEILSLGTQALKDGWLSYDLVGIAEPVNEVNAVPVDNFRVYSGYGVFVWVVDWAKVAREVQLAFYNNTNVQITDSHVSPVDMATGTVSHTSSNNNYGTTSSRETGYFDWVTSRYAERETQTYTRFGDRFTSTRAQESSEAYETEPSYYADESTAHENPTISLPSLALPSSDGEIENLN